MIPFSGFMQAVTDSVPVFGDKTVNIGKNIHGLPENDDAILSSDDNTLSFLALVQTLMDSGAAGATDGGSVFDIQNSDRESDWPTLDQLKTLIANTMNQTPAGQDVAPPQNTRRLDGGQVVFPVDQTPAAGQEVAPPQNTRRFDGGQVVFPVDQTPAAGQEVAPPQNTRRFDGGQVVFPVDQTPAAGQEVAPPQNTRRFDGGQVVFPVDQTPAAGQEVAPPQNTRRFDGGQVVFPVDQTPAAGQEVAPPQNTRRFDGGQVVFPVDQTPAAGQEVAPPQNTRRFDGGQVVFPVDQTPAAGQEVAPPQNTRRFDGGQVVFPVDQTPAAGQEVAPPQNTRRFDGGQVVFPVDQTPAAGQEVAPPQNTRRFDGGQVVFPVDQTPAAGQEVAPPQNTRRFDGGQVVFPVDQTPAAGQEVAPPQNTRRFDGGQVVFPVDQTPAAGQEVAPPQNTRRFDGGQVPFPQGKIVAIIPPHDGIDLTDHHAHKASSVIQEMNVAKENPLTVGQPQPFADDPPHQTNISGIVTHTGQGDDGQIKAKPFGLEIKENNSTEGLEKVKTESPFKPVAHARDEEKYYPNRFIQERLPSGLGIPVKANEPVTNQPHHPIGGQTKDPESMATTLTDQKTATSEDNRANSQGNAKTGQRHRIDLANVNENELTKDQSPDSVKNSVPELTKAAPSFQDTAKAMAADPSTNMAVKQTAGQAAELTRTEASAVRAFQTTVMDQIVDKAAIRSIHGRSEFQIRLKPEFLGNVQVNIATDKDQLVVRIVTDQPVVKEIIETHLHHLKTELQNQGLTIDKFDVTVNPDADQQHRREPFAQMFKNHSSPNGRRQPQEQNPQTHHRGDGNESDDDARNREGVNYFA